MGLWVLVIDRVCLFVCLRTYVRIEVNVCVCAFSLGVCKDNGKNKEKDITTRIEKRRVIAKKGGGVKKKWGVVTER